MGLFRRFQRKRWILVGIVICGALAAKLVFVFDLTNKGQETAGDSSRYEEELRKTNNFSVDDFSERFMPSGNDLPQFGGDPPSARFWPEIEKSRFKLNPEELAVFKKNGFVVSERLGEESFGSFFSHLYHSDLPVFVSADALLHAWHRSYDAIFEELETHRFAPQLEIILSSMAVAIPAAHREYGRGVLAESLYDADYFLAVARSLLQGNIVPCVLTPGNKDVAHTIKLIDEMGMGKMNLFGDQRMMDYSLFKPRGHYEKSVYLQRYFRCMMWCGVIDFHLDPKAPRGLATAIVLHDLLRRSGQFETWTKFDGILQKFVGWADSMTFAQLSKILEDVEIRSPSQIKDLKRLSSIQERIGNSSVGTHAIQGTGFSANYSEEGQSPPRSFTVMGQKFALDSWTTSKVVSEKRRIPSALDVAFAVFGNDAVLPLIVQRIKNKNGQPFRDGIPYQATLTAVRTIIDDQKQEFWSDNLYLDWLGLLRTLSVPTTDPQFPQSMRTQAWAMKTLNSQLASWTQIRHDTILYVKQSFTVERVCMYPAGFVEPRVVFWLRFQAMTERAAGILDDAVLPEQAAFCRRFSGTVKTLATLAEKELSQTPFSSEENKFLKNLLEITTNPGVCGASGITFYNGWYPQLFYKGGADSCEWDALVADVHTDSPDPDGSGDPGCILHEGVGNVDVMLVAVDNGPDRAVYVGPVFSHYEFNSPTGQRKTDSEWRRDIKEGKLPPRPEWTRSYLVPGNNPNAPSYNDNR